MRSTALDIIAIVQRAIEDAGVDLNPTGEQKHDEDDGDHADDAARVWTSAVASPAPTRPHAEGGNE